MKIISWVKKLLAIVRDYDRDMNLHARRMDGLQVNIDQGVRLIKDRTELDLDIGYRNATIITIGRYNGKEYIQTWNLPDDASFDQFIERLKQEAKYGQVRTVDCPPQFRTNTLDRIKKELE